MKRVAIVQSNYIPWRGYFDIIRLADEFVLYDTVQFTKRDWRNRNRIKTASGLKWLTIPVLTSGAYHQTIADTRIADGSWAAKHWRSLEHAYAQAPFFASSRDRWQAAFEACAARDRLSDVNRFLIEQVVRELGITTRITDAAEYDVTGDRTERLLAICLAAGATTYLSGPSAKSYLDVDLFERSGVSVEFMDYSGYAPYPQLHGSFENAVSVLDLIFNTGPNAHEHIRSTTR